MWWRREPSKAHASLTRAPDTGPGEATCRSWSPRCSPQGSTTRRRRGGGWAAVAAPRWLPWRARFLAPTPVFVLRLRMTYQRSSVSRSRPLSASLWIWSVSVKKSKIWGLSRIFLVELTRKVQNMLTFSVVIMDWTAGVVAAVFFNLVIIYLRNF